jgi:hypothetical protein
MSLTILEDQLATAQSRLMAALSNGDVAGIQAASQALAREVDQVRNVPVARAKPELKEGARLRLGYLADHGRHRLQMLLRLTGRSAAGQSRNVRIRVPQSGPCSPSAG